MFINPVCSKKNSLVVETRDHGTALSVASTWVLCGFAANWHPLCSRTMDAIGCKCATSLTFPRRVAGTVNSSGARPFQPH